jgi:hypothetical protein
MSLDPKPGIWYWGFKCRGCSHWLAAEEDPHRGTAEYGRHEGSIERRCIRCGVAGRYSVAAIDSALALPQ